MNATQTAAEVHAEAFNPAHSAPERRPMATYLLSIFDDDPASSGNGAWPSHDGLEIEANSDEEALDEAASILDVEAVGLNRTDGYTVGQTLHAMVTGPDEMIVGMPTLTLTEEHLGN